MTTVQVVETENKYALVTSELQKSGKLEFVECVIYENALNEYAIEDLIDQIHTMILYGFEITEELIDRIIEVIFQTTYNSLDATLYLQNPMGANE
jgi:hypothetical protein